MRHLLLSVCLTLRHMGLGFRNDEPFDGDRIDTTAIRVCEYRSSQWQGPSVSFSSLSLVYLFWVQNNCSESGECCRRVTRSVS